jgi:hypothetical protein
MLEVFSLCFIPIQLLKRAKHIHTLSSFEKSWLFLCGSHLFDGNILNIITVFIDKGALRIVDATDSHSEIDRGEAFYLDCCFYSHPYCPIITWHKDGVEIRDDSTIRKTKHGRTLQVHATSDAAGNYTCNATTPYGEAETYTIIDVKVISMFDMYFIQANSMSFIWNDSLREESETKNIVDGNHESRKYVSGRHASYMLLHLGISLNKYLFCQ